MAAVWKHDVISTLYDAISSFYGPQIKENIFGRTICSPSFVADSFNIIKVKEEEVCLCGVGGDPPLPVTGRTKKSPVWIGFKPRDKGGLVAL